MSKRISVSSIATFWVIALVVITAIVYGFRHYLDPVFVFSYAYAMKFCG